MSERKISVVWLCYFSNHSVQEHLKLWKRTGEIAPWITNLLNDFENVEQIELHVISEHNWLKREGHFTINKINYHFYNRGIPFIGKSWPDYFPMDVLTNYWDLKRKVKRIVKSIKPDIIHLHGAENEFCRSVLQFTNSIPVLITPQGFVHHSRQEGIRMRRRKGTEINIYRNFHYYSVRTETMREVIKQINPNSKFFWHDYPYRISRNRGSEKKYDIVYFAKITPEKGIEDLIRAIGLLKMELPEINAMIIGRGTTDYSKELKTLSSNLGLSGNIEWKGFIPTQTELHKLVSQAKISILPTYFDMIPGAIIESMFLGLPVIAYNVGSIHEINAHEEVIDLVEKGDIQGLAASIEKLLRDEQLRSDKSEQVVKRANEMFCHNDVKDKLVETYHQLISR